MNLQHFEQSELFRTVSAHVLVDATWRQLHENLNQLRGRLLSNIDSREDVELERAIVQYNQSVQLFLKVAYDALTSGNDKRAEEALQIACARALLAVKTFMGVFHKNQLQTQFVVEKLQPLVQPLATFIVCPETEVFEK